MGAPCVQDLEDIILTAVRGQDEMEVAIRIMHENICREAQLQYHIVQCLEMGSRCSLRSSTGGRAYTAQSANTRSAERDVRIPSLRRRQVRQRRSHLPVETFERSRIAASVAVRRREPTHIEVSRAAREGATLRQLPAATWKGPVSDQRMSRTTV